MRTIRNEQLCVVFEVKTLSLRGKSTRHYAYWISREQCISPHTKLWITHTWLVLYSPSERLHADSPARFMQTHRYCVMLITVPYRHDYHEMSVPCGCAAARLLGLRFQILPGAGLSVSCDCCVLSDSGLCVGLITRPGEFHLLWCVWV